MPLRKITPLPPVARFTGAHMVRTQVETIEEAVDLLDRRGAWRKPRRPQKVTLKAIFRGASLDAGHSKRIVGVSELREKTGRAPYKLSQTSNKGDPQLYHTLCGRCGTPREQTIDKLCPFYMKTKCLGELMRAEQQRELQAKKRKR